MRFTGLICLTLYAAAMHSGSENNVANLLAEGDKYVEKINHLWSSSNFANNLTSSNKTKNSYHH